MPSAKPVHLDSANYTYVKETTIGLSYSPKEVRPSPELSPRGFFNLHCILQRFPRIIVAFCDSSRFYGVLNGENRVLA